MAMPFVRVRARAQSPAPAPQFRDRVCASLSLPAGSSNADILTGLDARLARRKAAIQDPAAAALYARAFGGARSKPAAPVNTLAAKAGWGLGV